MGGMVGPQRGKPRGAGRVGREGRVVGGEQAALGGQVPQLRVGRRGGQGRARQVRPGMAGPPAAGRGGHRCHHSTEEPPAGEDGPRPEMGTGPVRQRGHIPDSLAAATSALAAPGHRHGGGSQVATVTESGQTGPARHVARRESRLVTVRIRYRQRLPLSGTADAADPDDHARGRWRAWSDSCTGSGNCGSDNCPPQTTAHPRQLQRAT